MNIEDYKRHILQAFIDANARKSKCSPEILGMDGMTGKKTRHLYNNLGNMPDARYLEVGVYTGSSLCSIIYGNSLQYAYGIDNWSQFDGPKQAFLDNIETFKGSTPVSFLESDFLLVDPKTLPKFNIYLFDGGHEYKDHYNALTQFVDCLDDIFIFIVDDWNWYTVRSATIAALQNCGYTILYYIEMKTTSDNSHPEGEKCTEEYWNGVCVFLLQKPQRSSNKV